MSRRSHRTISLAVAVMLGVVLLYLSLRGIDWREVARIIAGADAWRLGIAIALAGLTLFLRSLRWRTLLGAAGPLPVPSVFRATAAGYFGNNFLPARAGELIRMHMIARDRALPHAFVLATVVFERVGDAVALIALGAAMTITLGVQAGWMAGATRAIGVVGLVGVALVAAVPLLEAPAARLLRRVPMPGALRHFLLSSLAHGTRGMRAVHDPRRLMVFVGFTVVVWCVEAAGAMVTASALGLSLRPATAFLLLAALGLGSALPSTPGYVGIYQFVAVNVLAPFGFDQSDAIAYITVVQAVSWLVVGVCGGVALLRARAAVTPHVTWKTATGRAADGFERAAR